MKRFYGHIGTALCMVLLAGCGPSTFLIDKAGTSAYFGSKSPFLHKMLCTRDELRLILADADLPREMEGDFYRYTCSEERSYEKVISLYLILTPVEKMRLKRSFEKYGYEVNHLHCCS
jgi:hypothetical protein